jgi:hypothetical protein
MKNISKLVLNQETIRMLTNSNGFPFDDFVSSQRPCTTTVASANQD